MIDQSCIFIGICPARLLILRKKNSPCTALFGSARLMFFKNFPTCTFILYCMSIWYTRVGKLKKSNFSKLHWTTKILIVYLIKNSSLFYFLPKKWWSCDCFFFPTEAPKNFWDRQKRFKIWILDLKVCLKKLGLGSGLYKKVSCI